MISNANSVEVQNNLIIFSLSPVIVSLFSISYLAGHNLMTVGHCVRDHGTEIKK